MSTPNATERVPPNPPPVLPWSQFERSVERRPAWAPLGWLLVALTTSVAYAAMLVLSPLLLTYVGLRRLRTRRLRYHRRPEDLRIAVVGAGWTSLQCLARLKQLGVSHVDVFERAGRIGGTWGPDLRYHGLQTHASMTVTSFDGLPFSDDPDVQGGKACAEEVEAYIHRFADQEDLHRHVRLDAHVDRVHCRSEDRTATVELSDPRTGEQWTAGPYDLVVWASMAAYGKPPRVQDTELFRGRSLHTVDWSEAAFDRVVREDQHVVVVGGGKTACDVVLGLVRAGHTRWTWVMRKPYLFYRYEPLLHASSALQRLRGLSYLATVLWTGLSMRLGAVLHWASGYLWTFGPPHLDFKHFHGGVVDPQQRRELTGLPHLVGSPERFTEDALVLADGRELRADTVIWATGYASGIETLGLDKDGEPFTLDPSLQLYNHFVVPHLPVLASATALWTVFGPMRGVNTADLAVHHLCVRSRRSEEQMARSAHRQLSRNSLVRSFIWARDACWLQQWVRFHVDLVLQGITPVERFLQHALEVFVLSKETPLRFDLLPREAARRSRPGGAA